METILHTRISSFWCSVERLHDRQLVQRPIVISPVGKPRAQVWDVSLEAGRMGIYRGMPLDLAKKRCRDLVAVPPHPELYQQETRKLSVLAEQFTPQFQVTDTGKLFLDVTGTELLFGAPETIVHRMGTHLMGDRGFRVASGIAQNLLTAEMAVKVIGQARNNACMRIKPGDERTFLAPLPSRHLPTLTPRIIGQLRDLNLIRVGHIAQCAIQQLVPVFRRNALRLWRMANGLDDRRIQSPLEPPFQVDREHLFSTDTNDFPLLQATLARLIDESGYELRMRNRFASHIQVTLRFSDAVEHTRKAVFTTLQNDFLPIYEIAEGLLEKLCERRVRVRMMGVMLREKNHTASQGSLFPEDPVRSECRAVTQVMDTIRKRFGWNAVLIGKELGAS